jgi:phosphoribosyl 1,2-cyclic phosphate phosphodiesterase
LHLQILGTAAAEGWPAIFCGCETCSRARSAGGKNIRSRASLQIDRVYKIDLPPDTYLHSAAHGLSLSKLKCLLFTHSHGDHFAPHEILYLKPPFAHNLEHVPIKIYGNQAVIGTIESNYGDTLPIELIEARPFEPIQADYLTFIPIKAQHKPDEVALNYVIQSADATVLYASDTGTYADETIEHLLGYAFDVLIVECTLGTLGIPPTGHMGFEAVLDLREKLSRGGALRPNTRTVITHFSHNIGLLHDELEAIAVPEGVEVAYDGIEIGV